MLAGVLRQRDEGAPFVLLFGRSDSTISYMGANIYPLDIENGLYRDNPRAHLIESFRIEPRELPDHEHRPALHIQRARPLRRFPPVSEPNSPRRSGPASSATSPRSPGTSRRA
ncbi:hypothetical protein IOD13_03225 [Brevibacterium casei]|nr:hypothetical protein [Brevibacterium casei]